MNHFIDLTGDTPRYYWDSEDDQSFDVEMILSIASPECPVPYAKNLENALLPTAEKVAEKVERALA
jgi:pyruvate/2-oxoglutarate/acetoin dehydrogenase E1 component